MIGMNEEEMDAMIKSDKLAELAENSSTPQLTTEGKTDKKKQTAWLTYILLGLSGILTLGKIFGLITISWWVALFPAIVWAVLVFFFLLILLIWTYLLGVFALLIIIAEAFKKQ